MKETRHTVEQVAFGLRQAGQGTLMAEVCRKLGLSDQSSIAGKRSSREWRWPDNQGLYPDISRGGPGHPGVSGV